MSPGKGLRPTVQGQPQEAVAGSVCRKEQLGTLTEKLMHVQGRGRMQPGHSCCLHSVPLLACAHKKRGSVGLQAS